MHTYGSSLLGCGVKIVSIRVRLGTVFVAEGQMALRPLSDVQFIVGGPPGTLDRPEGVTWGPDGFAYAGGEAGQIYRIDVESKSFEEIAKLTGFVAGLCCDRESNIYACNITEQRLYRVTADGDVSEVSAGTDRVSMKVPNYPCFHPSGDLYVSDSETGGESSGCIFRVTRTGETLFFSDASPKFTNGLCVDRSGEWLYVVESRLPGVSRIRSHDDGSAGERQVVATLPDHVPDGVQFDEEGVLYITMYTPDRIYRLYPDGGLELLVEDPTHETLSSPSNIAFGGSDRRMLLISSLGRWQINGLRVEVAGLPLNYGEPIGD